MKTQTVGDIFRERFCSLFVRKNSKKKESQTQFASSVRLSRNTIASYATGRRVPDILSLGEICYGRKVSADWLLGLSDVKNPKAVSKKFLCDSTGLLPSVIDAFLRIQMQDGGEVKMRAINKALSSEKLLSVLCSIMMVESEESGYFEGTCSPEKGFYNVRMSPDSYAASLEFRLLHILEEVRTGNETPLESYPPYERELEAALEELRANGRIGSDENGEP